MTVPPQQYTHSIKIEDTTKGIRLSVHVYANNKSTAINETVATYLETKHRCEKEKIFVAPMEISDLNSYII
ncbi:MAG: hypothetical protein QN718_10140 [Nitrososphaeraceae archaeon]|nr:hypothetical protein [Nitrososphaeraceae archaeon]MDW0178775.1 hypothetical protein [Nitrososphaeraceae archaeon]MDW0294416.1 hypothetical protein [Nitrososphaeraceae archaeon]